MESKIEWKFSIIEEVDGKAYKTTYHIKEVGDGKLKIIQRKYGQSDYLWTEYEYELTPIEFVEFLIQEHDPKTIIHDLLSKILFEKSLATLKT